MQGWVGSQFVSKTTYANTGASWLRLSIPYRKDFGPGGEFWIDVAIHPSLGYCIQSWANAQNQAIAAAKSMLGMETEYTDIPWLWSDQYHFNIQILGSYQPERTEQIVVRKSADDQCSYLYLDHQNCLINMIAINDSKLIKLAKRWMQSNTVLDPKLLADPEFNVMKLKP